MDEGAFPSWVAAILARPVRPAREDKSCSGLYTMRDVRLVCLWVETGRNATRAFPGVFALGLVCKQSARGTLPTGGPEAIGT